MEISPAHAVLLLLGGVYGGLIFMVALGFSLFFFLQRYHMRTSTWLTGKIPATPAHEKDSSQPPIPRAGLQSPAPSLQQTPCPDRIIEHSSTCMPFTYEELAKATDDFSESNLLGQGGFGPVHKGLLLDGKLVAVKQLNSKSIRGGLEFQSQIEIINRAHHKHVASLVGVSIDGDKRLLVYEYMDNNSLAFYLHGSEVPTMDWATRMRIAIGAANGLAYLHDDCEPRIIHGNIKPTNILLDSNFKAKVSEFGIAKCTVEADPCIISQVAGATGYLAPEFRKEGRLTEKSDVYAFGVVLLELISGRKPLNLVHWAKPLLLQALRDDIYDAVVDPKLANEYNLDEMLRMVVCVLACVDHAPGYRPKILEVVRMLEGIMPVEELKAIVISRGASNNSQIKRSSNNHVPISNCTPFTYEELAKATDDFSRDNLLGEGGFGPVHKGVLLDGKLVAVKQLNSKSSQGESEFLSEIQIISRVHHRNLVSLVGFCIDGDKRLLVYEYMENNSLAFHLYGSEVPALDWDTRMRIAVDAANGFSYLHENCDPRIIHRDIKSANILLNCNFRAKVSDFGISKCFLDADTHVTATQVMGTPGYIAPEYVSQSRITDKSDVYAFGAVLLELVSGRKPFNFVHSATPLLLQALRDDVYDAVVDPNLADAYNCDEMLRMVVCILGCLDHRPEDRPKMLEVARVLEGTMSVEDLKTRVISRGTSNGGQVMGTRRLDQSPPAFHVQDQGYGSTPYTPPLVQGSNLRKRKNFWKFPRAGAVAFYARDQRYDDNYVPKSNCKPFKYKELAKATNDFSRSNLLGEGGSGCDYKGILLNRKLVAVKVYSAETNHAESEFRTQIEIMSHIRHEHLVSLLGFCIDAYKTNKRLLVFEYMENKSLAWHLHGSGAPIMNWAIRMQIAIGAAKGLAYLHEDCEPTIIHRDIKPSNILLDSNFEAKLSDLALAKCINADAGDVTTRVVGTYGYAAPEYIMSGILTKKVDVYSFGVVLFELITGKKRYTSENEHGFMIEKCLPLALGDDIYDEVDARLGNAYDRDEMLRMAVCAAACVDHEPNPRPGMLEVARILEGTMSIEELKARVMSRAGSDSTSQTAKVEYEGYDSTTWTGGVRMACSSQCCC